MKIRLREGEYIDLKKPSRPFKEFKIKKPISLIEDEHRSSEIKSPRRLARNFIYLKYAIVYCFGYFYRSLFGLYVMHSYKEDKEATLNLDFYLHELEKSDNYWVKCFKIKPARYSPKTLYFKGVPWIHGGESPPKVLRIRDTVTVKVRSGDRVYIRKNNMGKFLYYDLEVFCLDKQSRVVLRLTELIWNRIKKHLEKVPEEKINWEFKDG